MPGCNVRKDNPLRTWVAGEGGGEKDFIVLWSSQGAKGRTIRKVIGGKNTKKNHASPNARKKFVQAETEEKIIAEGKLTFKVKCQGKKVLKIKMFPGVHAPGPPSVFFLFTPTNNQSPLIKLVSHVRAVARGGAGVRCGGGGGIICSYRSHNYSVEQ